MKTMYKLSLINKEEGCRCGLMMTESSKIAKKCVELINGATCCNADGCKKASMKCHCESVKVKCDEQ